ncbi:MAG: RNA pseudouridine synthase, partial [Xanthomonadaceae bacterium]|nr:RNA pseudouridine synthase [Xanthomonadaceae bacterium]
MSPGAEQRVRQRVVVTTDQADRRVDQAAASIWSDYSRSRLADWIRGGQLRVNDQVVKPNYRLSTGEHLELNAEFSRHDSNPEPQAMAIDVLHADDALLVVNKPPGLVVHPGSGNLDGTLINGLLHYDPRLETLPRAGLVHRLDKDTSGCLIIARTASAHNH